MITQQVEMNELNSNLSIRIIDSFLRIIKWNIIELKPVLLTPRGRRPTLTKLIILIFIFSMDENQI